MQRHRHNHVCAERLAFARHNFREARRKPIAQAGHFFIFQQQDGMVQSAVVQPITSRAIESVVALAAQPAQRFRNFDTRNCRRPAGHHEGKLSRRFRARCSRGRSHWKRPPATLTHRLLYRLERRQARLAYRNAAGSQQRGRTDPARRRKQHCCKRVNGGSQYQVVASKREEQRKRYFTTATKDRW